MQQAQHTNWHTLIVGLGKTGLSIARYLSANDVPFAVMDTRSEPPSVDTLNTEFPGVDQYFGGLSAEVMCTAQRMIVSPGIALATPEIEKARSLGIEVIGDIELFAREARAPIVAITGSNGKTTVTTLLDMMAKAASIKVATGGNIGMPALELLNQRKTELYILELSSFQLETTESLKCKAACILNITEDHLDRYAGRLDLYAAAKAKIYKNCEVKIVNRDDETVVKLANDSHAVTFGAGPAEADHFGVLMTEGGRWLAKGNTKLLNTSEMKLVGGHHEVNALAALALAEALGIDLVPCLDAIKAFDGLEHRTQWVGEHNGINWYNDSKGTNVGATVAALQGLPGKTILLAGGQGKGADFSPLADVVQKYARAVILFGEDAELIALALKGDIPIVFANDMTDAVKQAQSMANIGDNVLLSPACASFDMFSDYEQRGRVYMDTVKQEVLC